MKHPFNDSAVQMFFRRLASALILPFRSMRQTDFYVCMGTLMLFWVIAVRLVILVSQKNDFTNVPYLPKVERGSIYDRNGFLLAQQIETFTVDLWLPDLQSLDPLESEEQAKARIKQTTEALAPIVLWPAQPLYEKLCNPAGPKNVNLLRKASKELCDQIRALTKTQEIRGLRITPDQSRLYPQGALAANLLGYVNLDNQGGDGLEYSYERILSPAGLDRTLMQRISGSSLELTIDIPLQSILERKMQHALVENKASSAMAIVADAKTAEILAYVSVPTYDPNSYNLSSPTERLNRPVVQIYEPGSVFKIFTIASVLDTGNISPEEKFFCPGYHRINTPKGPITIKCTGVHGYQSVAQVLANSCNAGTAAISTRIDSREFYQRLQNFGFGSKTHIHLPGETTGLLSDPSRWSLRSKPTIAIGQEVGVQAMQIIQAATAFTNNGVMLRPRIVRRILAEDGSVVQEYPRQTTERVLSPHVANAVFNMLELGVDAGIARRMRVPGFRIGAKTGTSQTYDFSQGSYSQTNYTASALAYFPMQDPHYIVYMVIFDPHGRSYYGANIVAPLIGELAREMIPLYGLPSEGINTLGVRRKTPKQAPIEPQKLQYLPNFVGMTRTDWKQFCTSHPYLSYKITGNGFVIADQFPPPGTLITPHLTVRLEFAE